MALQRTRHVQSSATQFPCHPSNGHTHPQLYASGPHGSRKWHEPRHRALATAHEPLPHSCLPSLLSWPRRQLAPSTGMWSPRARDSDNLSSLEPLDHPSTAITVRPRRWGTAHLQKPEPERPRASHCPSSTRWLTQNHNIPREGEEKGGSRKRKSPEFDTPSLELEEKT